LPKLSRNTIVYLLILVAVIAIFFTVFSGGGGRERLQTLALIDLLKESGGEVTIQGETLTAIINGVEYETNVPADFNAFEVFDLEIIEGKITIDYEK